MGYKKNIENEKTLHDTKPEMNEIEFVNLKIKKYKQQINKCCLYNEEIKKSIFLFGLLVGSPIIFIPLVILNLNAFTLMFAFVSFVCSSASIVPLMEFIAINKINKDEIKSHIKKICKLSKKKNELKKENQKLEELQQNKSYECRTESSIDYKNHKYESNTNSAEQVAVKKLTIHRHNKKNW